MLPPRGLGDAPPSDPWRWRIDNAKTVADLVPILARTVYEVDATQRAVRDTYVGGKHADEAQLAARKLAIAEYLQRVRLRLAAYQRRIEQMTGDEPIPPDLWPLVRQVGGYTDPLPDAYAARVARERLDALIRDAGPIVGGNLPKIPLPGSPTGIFGGSGEWAVLLLLVAAAFILSRTRFEVQV